MIASTNRYDLIYDYVHVFNKRLSIDFCYTDNTRNKGDFYFFATKVVVDLYSLGPPGYYLDRRSS